MKKFFLLMVLVLPLALSVVACGGGDSDVEATQQPPDLVTLLNAAGQALDEAAGDPGTAMCWDAKTACRLHGMACDLQVVAACQQHGHIPADFMPLDEYLPQQ